MNKWQKHSYNIRQILMIVILIDIIFRSIKDTKALIIYSLFFLFIIVNDYIRYNYLYKKPANIYYSSVVISILLAGILVSFEGGYVQIYLWITLIDIAFIMNKRVVKYLHVLNIFVLVFSNLFRITLFKNVGIVQFVKEDVVGFVIGLVSIFFYMLSIYYFRALILEKKKVEKLNEEIEELTISKERNRIAQNIHDNLGHSLVALNMNLDVASNVIDEDKDKAKELLIKCQQLTKDSMDSLRKAVSTLKEEDLSEGFLDSVKEMIDNINDTSKIAVIYYIDENIEDVSLEVKSIIYTTIKESLTNSIRHGKPTEIHINLYVKDKIELSIKDNGIGCKNFIKGYGLAGIEEKISQINGYIEYDTVEGKGFEIKVSI